MADRTPGVEDADLYHLDANSAAACAFIERRHDEPFFFYCAYRAPHVSAIDDGIGRMMRTLRKYGLEERTLIFLMGDNGAPLKIHKLEARSSTSESCCPKVSRRFGTSVWLARGVALLRHGILPRDQPAWNQRRTGM